MVNLLVMLAFLAMVLSPCLVAMSTGVTDGADLGVKDLSEPGPGSSDERHIPG